MKRYGRASRTNFKVNEPKFRAHRVFAGSSPKLQRSRLARLRRSGPRLPSVDRRRGWGRESRVAGGLRPHRKEEPGARREVRARRNRRGRWEPGLPSRLGVRKRGAWRGWEITTPPPGRCQEAAASAPTARLIWGVELAVTRGGRAARRA